MWEDAAANSVGAGGVDMPADVQQDKKKKNKSPQYDGRTKEGRKFVEKMLARRKAKAQAQQVNASKQNVASVAMKEENIEEANLAQLKRKYKRDIDNFNKRNKDLPKKVEDELMKYAMDNDGIGDDPDEFDDWLVKNIEESKELVDEAMSDKEKKKRLAMIKKSVERINSKNADKAKKDALKMMKDSGMFDETVEEAKAPKIKGLSMYGSEINGLKQGMKTFSAKPVISKGKLAYRVVDEFGGFETLGLKAFAKKFG